MRLAEALTIIHSTSAAAGVEFRLALICGFTPLHLKTFLAARLRLAFPQRRTEIQTGLYGDLLGDLQRLRSEPADRAVIVLEWPDLDGRLGIRSLRGWRQSNFQDVLDNVRIRLAEIQDAITAVIARTTVVIGLPTLPLPPFQSGTPTWRASSFDLCLQQLLSSFALELAGHSTVKIVNGAWLDQVSPPSGRFDAKSELLSGFPYSVPHASAFSGVLANLIEGPPLKKGLITDLDNTLWKGILGEIGVENVSWDFDLNSHIHAVYQELLCSLSETGALIAIASKNDASLVDEVFLRKDMILHKERIFPMEVHWGAKSGSITRILKTWNVAPDSVVFVDDSAAELAEVAAVHPAMECLQFPESPNDVLKLLTHLRNLFAKQVVTEEDRIRLTTIRTSHQIQEDLGPSAVADAFLEQAASVLTFSLDKESPDPRVLDLFNKTNQFNLNGKRFTEASLRLRLADPRVFLLKTNYADKFGTLGKIALVLGSASGTMLYIHSWVMSCRAFSRRIEHACLDYLFRKFDVESIEFDFMATDRNIPLQDFLAEFAGKDLESPTRLSRDLFREKCALLFHRIEEEQVNV